MHPNAQSSTIYNSRDPAASEMLINSAMDKEDVVYVYMYTHSGILLSHKRR